MDVEDNPWADSSGTGASVAAESGQLSEAIEVPITKIGTEQQQQVEPSTEGIDLIYAIGVIDFHHIRGPEIEYWCDLGSGSQAEKIELYSKKWPNLPFQALPDGAHLFEETFSNFTLLDGETSLFGCACIRQLAASQLAHQSDEITRSIVQKSIVLITRYPITVQLREKLSIVTRSLFEQRDFRDKKIIDELFENIVLQYNSATIENESMEFDSKRKDHVLYESDFYMGLSLKEMLMRYKRNLLVIFKAMLLEKKIVFFGKDLLKLSNYQYSMISLIPDLILNLQDCASPRLSQMSKDLTESTSFNTLDRGSILRFLGLPLQLFGEGGFFEPYLALQQLDSLAEADWYMIGTSNDLLLDQRRHIADIIVYIDHPTKRDGIEFLDPELEQCLQLSGSDKKFMDLLMGKANAAKTDVIPTGGTENGTSSIDASVENSDKAGNSMYSDLVVEDLIRNSFENYLIGFISCVKLDYFKKIANETQLQQLQDNNNMVGNHDGFAEFNRKFVQKWMSTRNFKLFNARSYLEFFTMEAFKPGHVMDQPHTRNLQLMVSKFWSNLYKR